MTLALSGHRVIDLAGEAGAYGTKLLADLGAEVIKVERLGGDPTRGLPPFRPGVAPSEASLWFAYMNTNKRSVTLDLQSAQGQDLFRRLVATSDVVFETSAPGDLDEMGVGPTALLGERADLVWVAISPFGQTGPRRHWKGSDLIAWATSGVLHATGDADRPPVVPAGAVRLAYALASLNGAIGALLALRARRLFAQGQIVDISVQEAAVAVSGEIGLPAFLDDLVPRGRSGNRRPSLRPWGLYPCRDGWASIVVGGGQHHWTHMAKWITEVTENESASDPAFTDVAVRYQAPDLLDEWTEGLTSRYTRTGLFREGQARGVPVAPVNTATDILGDEHLHDRRYWVEVSHPGLGDLRMAGAPYRLSKTPWRAGRAPLLGEHNEAIFVGELGLTSEELDALRAARAI